MLTVDNDIMTTLTFWAILLGSLAVALLIAGITLLVTGNQRRLGMNAQHEEDKLSTTGKILTPIGAVLAVLAIILGFIDYRKRRLNNGLTGAVG